MDKNNQQNTSRPHITLYPKDYQVVFIYLHMYMQITQYDTPYKQKEEFLL